MVAYLDLEVKVPYPRLSKRTPILKKDNTTKVQLAESNISQQVDVRWQELGDVENSCSRASAS